MRRLAPGTRALTAAVAAGFGVLGWLAAQLITLYLFGHGHADNAGHGYRHMHGLAGPVAVSAGCLAIAALIALRLLSTGADGPVRPGSSTGPCRGLTVVIPVVAFAGLGMGEAVASGGARPGHVLAVLAVGVALQVLFARAAQALTGRCVDLVTTPLRLDVPVPSLPMLRLAPAGYVHGFCVDLAAGFPARAPPPATGS